MRKKFLSLLMVGVLSLSTIGFLTSFVNASETEEQVEDQMEAVTVEQEDTGLEIINDKSLLERNMKIVRLAGHMFLMGEKTTYTKDENGKFIFHPNSNEHNEEKCDYIVVDGAKYTIDGKTLLAAPFNETVFVINEGTEKINMSALLWKANYYESWVEVDEGDTWIKLQEIVFPKSLKKIDFSNVEDFLAWHSKVDVEKITFQNDNLSVKTISNLFRYFNHVKASKVTFPKGMSKLKNGMLIYKKYVVKYNGKKKKVVIPKGVKGIEAYAFTTYSMSEYQDDDYDDFEYYHGSKKLKYVVLPKSLEKIGKYAFLDCPSLKKVFIPKKSKLKKIGKGAFMYTKIKTKKIKEQIKRKK